ncbi:MAG: exonuclease domain-containing protein [Lachnospiraceae bacterium]|nr:exonuclease domain-containing protein [Lachnospiraceae bacterium]
MIVIDLEWNQSSTKSDPASAVMPFEIIEIGAVKYGEDGLLVSEFSELIKPRVYKKMHNFTSKLVHLQMEELEKGDTFENVSRRFFEWCGPDPVFVTWGPGDINVFQQNLKYFGLPLIGNGPVAYIDAQKLFMLLGNEDKGTRRNLEYAVDHFGIEKDIPFHRAFSDAYYTAQVLRKILEKDTDVIKFISYDITFPPADKASEITAQFPTYEKWISRVFKDRDAAFRYKETLSTKCYLCGKKAKRRIRWFSMGDRKYYCLGECEEHGLIKGKIIMHPCHDPEGVFIVKTLRCVNEKEAAVVEKKFNKVREYRKHNTAGFPVKKSSKNSSGPVPEDTGE